MSRLNRLLIELRKERPLRRYSWPDHAIDYEVADSVRRVVCADGFSVSVQASRTAYCRPRDNHGPWLEVELGYPTARPTDEVMEYCEDPDEPTGTVYGYVPIEAVERLLDAHGGFDVFGLAIVHGCPIPVTDADSEAVARDWLLQMGYLKEEW